MRNTMTLLAAVLVASNLLGADHRCGVMAESQPAGAGQSIEVTMRRASR